jgi:serine/threonine-protein kinase HipA
MIRTLDVYLYDAHVATITRRGENLQLRYLPEYVESDSAVPISVTLPVVTTPFGNDDTKRFLDNLLPDRADVRSRWAREAKLTSDSSPSTAPMSPALSSSTPQAHHPGRRRT